MKDSGYITYKERRIKKLIDITEFKSYIAALFFNNYVFQGFHRKFFHTKNISTFRRLDFFGFKKVYSSIYLKSCLKFAKYFSVVTEPHFH